MNEETKEAQERLKNNIKSDFSKIDFTQISVVSKVIIYVLFTFQNLLFVLFFCLRDIIFFRWLNIPHNLQLLFVSEQAIKEILFKR